MNDVSRRVVGAWLVSLALAFSVSACHGQLLEGGSPPDGGAPLDGRVAVPLDGAVGVRDGGSSGDAATGEPDAGCGAACEPGASCASDADCGGDKPWCGPEGRCLGVETVAMPLEVYPSDGVSEHTESLELLASSVAGVDRLYVQAHQPFYHVGGTTTGEWEGWDVEGAVSIRINGGAWVDVRNENVTCAFPESHYGPDNPNGCIGGGYATVRFTLPADGVAEGRNTVDFRFNGTRGVRAGFRVLAVGLMREGDDIQTFDPRRDGAHDGTRFVRDYGDGWRPPAGYGDEASVAAGRELFMRRDLLIDRIYGEAREIRAACNDCHAMDGVDLQYFGYSNRSIISRSRFHGLSEEQGSQIAAYIRSLELRTEDGTRYDPPGTPWDPPFQPGTTQLGTGRPAAESDPAFWAAGAGLDDVLDHDEEMLPHVFPRDGDPANGVDYITDPVSGERELNWEHIRVTGPLLDLTRYPIALQLPDWNNWLPDVAPVEDPAFESADYYMGRNAWTAYLDLVGNPREATWSGLLESMNPHGSATDRQTISEAMRVLGEFVRRFRGKGGSDALDIKRTLSGAQWGAVRIWEIFQHYHLYDDGQRGFERSRYPADHYSNDWTLPLGIWGRSRHFFDMAPHIVGGFERPPFAYGTRMGGKYFTHAWYHLQTIIDPGVHPRRSGQGPVDWQYQAPHMTGLSSASGVGGAYRMLVSEVRRWQMFYTPELGVGVGTERGDGLSGRRWNPRHTTPLWLMQNVFEDTPGPPSDAAYSNLDREARRQLATAALRSWWEAHSSFSLEDYQAFQCDDEERCWEPADFVPAVRYIIAHDYADRYYQQLRPLHEHGVPDDLLEPISDWCAAMWPRGNDASAVDGLTWESMIP
jgi:hypothetical protein